MDDTFDDEKLRLEAGELVNQVWREEATGRASPEEQVRFPGGGIRPGNQALHLRADRGAATARDTRADYQRRHGTRGRCQHHRQGGARPNRGAEMERPEVV